MGVPTSEVGYTSATVGRGDHEVHKGHVGYWGDIIIILLLLLSLSLLLLS
jgi:purine-cytosine permease-like protein